jgi:hypothetical protein
MVSGVKWLALGLNWVELFYMDLWTIIYKKSPFTYFDEVVLLRNVVASFAHFRIIIRLLKCLPQLIRKNERFREGLPAIIADGLSVSHGQGKPGFSIYEGDSKAMTV